MPDRARLAVAALLCILLLGCAREDPLVRSMRENLKGSAGMLVGAITQRRSFSDRDSGDIWTAYSILVKRSDRAELPPGKEITAYRRGGSVPVGAGKDRVEMALIVDDGINLPGELNQDVFLVLKVAGGRLVILDGVPVNADQFAVDRPVNLLYRDVLQELSR